MQKVIQLSLFSPIAQLAGLDAAIKGAMAAAADESKMSRAQGCDKMNELAAAAGIRLCANAKALSLPLFEKWLNPADREHIPSVKAVQVFCCVYQTATPWEGILQAFGMHALGPEEMRFYYIGKAQHEFEQAKDTLKKAKARAKQ